MTVLCCQACARVNVEGSRQFVNLLSVDVCEDELVKTVAEMTTARVKPPHPARGLKTEVTVLTGTNGDCSTKV